MNEGTKTLTYLAAALLVAIVAVLSIPRAPSDTAETPTGTMLNPVEDPLSAAELRIVEFNEDTSDASEFEVVHSNVGWVIPSHSDYPADAQEQMEAAASAVMNLKILSVASVERAAHETYGVVDPDDTKTTTGSQGVGTRVTMKDKDGKSLVEMIVGKEVKGQEGQRYVREAGKEPVYVVALDASKLSTNFDKWIEKDLLSLNAFDVSGLQLKDYSIEFSIGFDGRPQALMDPRSEIFLHNDPNAETSKQWEVVVLKEFDRESGEFKDVPVPEGAKVDAAKLNELKNALDDLKIVDVERKPQGLSADLKAEKDFVTNEEAFRSLAARGFYPVPVSETELEILSSEGEVICQMNDGVEYVLRFGKTVASSQTSNSDDGPDDDGINRYLFVTARFNPDLIPAPDLTPVPDAPAKDTPADDAKDSQDTDDTPKDDAETAPDASEGDSGDSAASQNDDAGEEAPSEDADANEPPASDEDPAAVPPEDAAEEAAPDADAEESTAPATPETPADESNESADTDDAGATADSTADTEAGSDTEQSVPPSDAERARIEAENKVKQDEYDAAVKKGQERVKELNERFGDWYYVISDSVYKKIHLGRKDILEEPETPTDGLDSLNKLLDQGLGQPGTEQPQQPQP